MFDTRYPVEVRETLASLGDDVVRKEQYLDFIKCRRFRQTLICRSEIKLERTASFAVIKEVLFSSSAKTASPDADLLDDSSVQFLGESDLKGDASAPVAKSGSKNDQRTASRIFRGFLHSISRKGGRLFSQVLRRISEKN